MAGLVGIDRIGFGSDFIANVHITASLIQAPAGQAVFADGGYSAAGGAMGAPSAPNRIVAALVETLLEHGYSETDCGKFLGDNTYRVSSGSGSNPSGTRRRQGRA